MADKLPDGKEWGYENWTWDFWLKQRRLPRSMLTLARNPYMLYMMTQVFTEEACIPQNRGVLFRLFVDFLLLDREKLSEADAETLKTRLAELAYTMQAKGEAGTSFNRSDTLRYLRDEPSLYRAQSANILSGTDEIRFTHQLLQEFFAAHKLDAEMQAKTPAATFWPPEKWWGPQGWEETAILLAGLYNDDCTPVLDWLQAANPEIAGRCVVESGARTPDETRARLRTLWLPRLAGNEPPHARAAVGRGLSHVGDPRPGVGLRSDGLPDIEWVEIPAGEFIFGDQSEKNSPKKLTLPTFTISRYPITYAQFQVFLDAEDGFNRDEWWAGLTEEYRKQPMVEQYFKFANHPRESVSWYQAVAFCRWLDALWRRRRGVWPYAPTDDMVIRLPTEQEWEKAARGTDGREYPYEGKFDANKGNTNETGIEQTSAVGIFPDGASPYGVLDMSGNVWEWCLNTWGGDTDLDGTATRVLRGGAWSRYQDFARAVFRNASRPLARLNLFGFRVVCARPPSR